MDKEQSSTSLSQDDLKISVSAKALKEVLAALTGSQYSVRDLVMTRGLIGYINPIDQLLQEYNTEIKKYVSESTNTDTPTNS